MSTFEFHGVYIIGLETTSEFPNEEMAEDHAHVVLRNELERLGVDTGNAEGSLDVHDVVDVSDENEWDEFTGGDASEELL